jgi:hypothetical protein
LRSDDGKVVQIRGKKVDMNIMRRTIGDQTKERKPATWQALGRACTKKARMAA